MKQLVDEYCEAMHPNDDLAQETLFESICDGYIKVSLEEMTRVVNQYKERSKNECDD